MAESPSITRSNTRGHAAFLYNTSDDRFEVLAKYFKEGVEAGELCVFVTADEPDVAGDKFVELGFAIHEPIQSGQLRIFGMTDIYLPDGRFAANYMLANVESFIKEARSLGYKGLRTAGEMSWIYDHPEFIEESHRYEDQINGLGDQNPDFIGLCLYPVKDQFAKVMHDASGTHPTFIYNGEPMANLHYLVS